MNQHESGIFLVLHLFPLSFLFVGTVNHRFIMQIVFQTIVNYDYK